MTTVVGNVPMARLFPILNSEWIPPTVTRHQLDISHYLMHRYNWIRPHQFNEGLQSAVAE